VLKGFASRVGGDLNLARLNRKTVLDTYSSINCCNRCGSSPNHFGFVAVVSKSEVVLNGSNAPAAAAAAVLAKIDSLS
jgi:hypothetical protein